MLNLLLEWASDEKAQLEQLRTNDKNLLHKDSMLYNCSLSLLNKSKGNSSTTTEISFQPNTYVWAVGAVV